MRDAACLPRFICKRALQT